MKDIPKEGMQVHVYSADKKEDWGLGTIEKVKPLRLMGMGLNISATFPSNIVLNSGKVTDELHCWWISVNKEEKMKVSLKARKYNNHAEK